MLERREVLSCCLVLALAIVLLAGCGGNASDASPAQATGSLPVRDPAQPLTVGEQGTVTLTNDRDDTLQVLRADGAPLFALPIKENTVIDPDVPFTIRTIERDLPEDLVDTYVAVGSYAFELHAAQETGYGFAFKPLLTIHYSQAELDAAREAGASLDVLKGNLIVLYKEQRSPKWVPQTSVSVNEDAGTVTVSNIAGAGAWRLVAKK
jgi:hypothetical protein